MIPTGLARWRRHGDRVQAVLRDAEGPMNDLALVRHLGQVIAEAPLQSERLTAWRPEARGVSREAFAAALRHLRWRAAWVESLRNAFFMPLAGMTCSGSRWAHDLEDWRRQHAPTVRAWFTGLARVDASMAVAAYAFEHPHDVYATWIEGEAPVLIGRAIRHPLLPPDHAVANDAHFDASHRAEILSGANMAGKSTWLRTLGTNVLLSRVGAPAAAQALTLSPFALGVSIGVPDDLLGGLSHFQAEIRHVAGIVHSAEAGQPTCFLMDELLGGTTSVDRQLGVTTILGRLLATSAIGIVTTHDLAITELANASPVVRNMHMGATVESGQLVFDHLVRPGVISSSSARALLHAAGLTPVTEPEALPSASQGN